MMAPRMATKIVGTAFLLSIFLAILLKTVDCGFPLYEEEQGFVTSPGFPQNYTNNLNYNYVINVPKGHRIKLEFKVFELESPPCSRDSVSVYDGRDENSTLLGQFCGLKLPPIIISTTQVLYLNFKTDGSVVLRGFNATYTLVSSIRSIPGLVSTERNLTQHLLEIRRKEERSINKWGPHLTRVSMALYLNDRGFFSPGNRTGEEITYELSLQLLSKLASRKKIATNDLTQFINALTVACIDPKNFFGNNMVEELRKRVNSSNQTNPFSILTLCNAKDSMMATDVERLIQQYNASSRHIWTDTQAMAVLALSCIRYRSDLQFNETVLNKMVSELKKKQLKNGMIENLKTTALVTQAMLAAGDHRIGFDVTAAVKFILQEVKINYPNFHEIYYILPIFKSVSLANISSDHCSTSVKTEVISSLREIPDERIQVQISVIVGDDMDFSRTWKIKVPSNYSFYQVLETVGTLEPAYKAQYSFSEGKPYIVSLANFQEDTEDGFFWFIYTRPINLSAVGILKLIDKSPVDINVTESEEFILWYRSSFEANSQGKPSG